MEGMIEQQWMEADEEKRKGLVWDIERRLTEDDAKPLIYFNRGRICWDPKFKGLTARGNSIYNYWRMDDVWLDQPRFCSRGPPNHAHNSPHSRPPRRPPTSHPP